MLQWFFSFPEFAEFTEILFHLGKTQLAYLYRASALTLALINAIIDAWKEYIKVSINTSLKIQLSSLPIQKGPCWHSVYTTYI